MLDQLEKYRKEIRGKRARIEEINLICQSVRRDLTARSLGSIIEEKLHLEEAVAALETEVARLERQQADRQFRWEDIDQRLLTAKTNDIVEEMSRRILESRRRIGFEVAQSGNTAGFVVRWLEFMEKFTEERVQRIYGAYCETWIQQNRTITPTFIRAVRDRVIAKVFSGARSSVQHQLMMRARSISQPVNPNALNNWCRKMVRLQARWYRKLEAEAVATGYKAERNHKMHDPGLQANQRSIPPENSQHSRAGLGIRASGRKAKAKPSFPAKRDTILFAAIFKHLEGPTYCDFLDKHKVKPKWSEDDLRSYRASYMSGGPYRKKVQDEKSRAKQRMSRYPHSVLMEAFVTYLPSEFDELSSHVNSRNSHDASKKLRAQKLRNSS